MNIKRFVSKVFTMVMFVVIVSSLCACGEEQGIPETTIAVTKTVDEEFISALAEGLNDRWEFYDSIVSTKDTKEKWESLINAEYDKISGFLDQTFENPELEKYAKDYIQSIIDSREAVADWNTEQWVEKYNTRIYHKRSTALFKINSIVPVTVNEKYREVLIDLLRMGEIADFTNPLIDEMILDIEDNPSGGKKLSTALENTTSITFGYFDLAIDIKDKDDVTIETAHAYADNWQPREKTVFEISVDDRFVNYKVNHVSWKVVSLSLNARY